MPFYLQLIIALEASSWPFMNFLQTLSVRIKSGSACLGWDIRRP